MSIIAELEERIGKCQKIMEVDPNSQIFAALAEAYRKKGDLEKAFRICQGGLRIHPSYGSAHVVMAKINLDRGLYDWAEAEIKKAIEIEGASRAIELLLAEIYIYKGEFNAAVKLLRKLYDADPNNDQIKKLLEIALKLPAEQAGMIEPRSGLDLNPSEISTETTADSGARPELVVSLSAPPDLIRHAVAIPDIEGALFINREGLVVDAQWDTSFDAHTCAATLAEVDNFLNQELVKASFGKVKSLLVENGRVVFYLVRVKDGLFLFAGNAKINLGTLRMRISALVDRYQVSR
ncbi:MAG: tetratricopeptide repeat protein [Candidatus Zixiibacteriota bacterium]